MDILIVIILSYCAVLLQWNMLRERTKMKLLQVQTQHVKPVIEVHRLVRTWMEPLPDDGAHAGWRWKCSCGTIGTGYCTRTSMGSEEEAVNRFVSHAAGYKKANADFWKDKYDALRVMFGTYRQKCYCKDTNDDLILLMKDQKFDTL